MACQHRFYSLLPMLIHLPAMQSYTGDLFHSFIFQFPGESIVCAAEVSFVADISDTCWLHYLLQWYVQFASNCFNFAPHDQIDNKSALILVMAYSRTRPLIHIHIAGGYWGQVYSTYGNFPMKNRGRYVDGDRTAVRKYMTGQLYIYIFHEEKRSKT